MRLIIVGDVMIYYGGKTLIANEIAKVISKYKSFDQWYVEPFCGGCNVIEHIEGKRLASDTHPYLIAMWKALQSGWIPPASYTEQDYDMLKNNKSDFPPELVGYVGFNSYGGIFFGGYRRDKIGTDYNKRYFRLVMAQHYFIKDVYISNHDYREVFFPKSSLIYCDPPYKDTQMMYGWEKKRIKFDHDGFWQWVRDMSYQGHKVIVSETQAPEDFKVIWEKKVKKGMSKKLKSKRTEKLFTL